MHLQVRTSGPVDLHSHGALASAHGRPYIGRGVLDPEFRRGTGHVALKPIAILWGRHRTYFLPDRSSGCVGSNGSGHQEFSQSVDPQGQDLCRRWFPLAGASIKLFHLSSEQLFETTTSGNGSFAATDLPYGYFDIAIETADGFFVTNSVVNLPPSDTLSISLKLAAAGTLAPDRSFPGVSQAATGSAIISGNVTGTSFWSSPKGIGTLAGGGAALLLLVAGGGSSNAVTSPTIP